MLQVMGSRESARRLIVGERLTAQLLAGEPARDAVGVVERLLAVQGQDPRGLRLAVRARTPPGRIRELHAANYYAYGYRRMLKALRRAGERGGGLI